LANDSTLSGVVSGVGSLTKDGSGTLTLNGLNSQTGGITVLSGTLATTENGNLGGAASALTLNGGRLQALATAEYNRAVIIDSSDGKIDTQANVVTVSGVVSGVGKLAKQGTGTLILSGVNTYKGGTSIEAGTLSISNQSNLGVGELSIQNATLKTAADLQLDRSVNVTDEATLDTSGHTVVVAGTVNGGGKLIKSGSGSLELTGNNTYSGGTILKSGTLTVATDSNLGIGNLQVLGGTLALKDGFSSSKTLTQDSINDIVIAGSSQFGNTVVNNGALVVNGTLTSPITIGVGGTLRGSGKVIGNTTVQGMLSPGNSPGILTVTGNLTQASTATLSVDIDGGTAGTGAGKHDQVIVSNTFKADGSLVAKLRGITGDASNSFTPSIGQSFEVVKANAVQGVFASYSGPTTATGLAAGTRLDVGYTPTSVVLYVTPESYSSVVSGGNRGGVARFLDETLKVARATPNALVGTTDLAKLYQALIPANAQMISDALVSMSPAIYAESAQSVLALQQTLHNTQTLSESFKKGGVAVKLLQQDTDVDSDGNGIAATRSVSGVQLAIDSEPYNNGWQMGATVSVINKGDITGQGAALDLSGQDITVALRKQTKEWLWVGELDRGSYQFDAKRHVVLGATTFTNAQDGVNAKTYGLGVSATRAITDNLQFLAGLRYNNVNQSGFIENGNGLLKLTVDKVQQNQIVATVGANWSQSFAAASWKVTPKVGLQLEQTLKGDTAQVDALLSTERLVSQASDAGKSLFRAMVGVSAANQSGLTVGVDATSEQGSNASGTTGRLILSKSF
jgi:autotransporter-associated beta strand protein